MSDQVFYAFLSFILVAAFTGYIVGVTSKKTKVVMKDDDLDRIARSLAARLSDEPVKLDDSEMDAFAAKFAAAWPDDESADDTLVARITESVAAKVMELADQRRAERERAKAEQAEEAAKAIDDAWLIPPKGTLCEIDHPGWDESHGKCGYVNRVIVVLKSAVSGEDGKEYWVGPEDFVRLSSDKTGPLEPTQAKPVVTMEGFRVVEPSATPEPVKFGVGDKVSDGDGDTGVVQGPYNECTDGPAWWVRWTTGVLADATCWSREQDIELVSKAETPVPAATPSPATRNWYDYASEYKP